MSDNIVDKPWGREDIWASCEAYSASMLHFNVDKKTKMHFHKEGLESVFVLNGKFLIRYIDTNTGSIVEQVLIPGDVWNTPSLVPHQIYCVESGVICEVSSTKDGDTFNISDGCE